LLVECTSSSAAEDACSPEEHTSPPVHARPCMSSDADVTKNGESVDNFEMSESDQTARLPAEDIQIVCGNGRAELSIDLVVCADDDKQKINNGGTPLIDSGSPPSLALPEIAIQVASPMVMSPMEEEGDLYVAMEKYTHSWIDMEQACEKADAEIKAEELRAHEHDSSSNVDPITSSAVIDAEELFDDEVQIAEETDDQERPLSPADYTLEDDGDFAQVDDHIDNYQTRFSAEDRAPSPSQYSLLVESTEESDLSRLTSTLIPDDVFAIPEPVAPISRDLSMYLEIQYGKHEHDIEITDSADDALQGTNVSECLLCFTLAAVSDWNASLPRISHASRSCLACMTYG